MRLALAVVLSATIVPATLVPVPGLNVNELVSTSDVVVGGYFLSSVDDGITFIETLNGRVPARRKIVDVRVSHVLKADVADGHKGTAGAIVKVAVLEPQRPDALGYGGFHHPHQFRIIFLRRAASGYVLTSPYWPSVIAAPRDLVTGASPVTQVAALVTAVLKAPGTSPQEKKIAVFTLSCIKDPAAVAGLRIASADTDLGVRLAALPERLRAGDVTALPLTESILLRNQPKVEWNDVVSILGGLGYTEWNEKAVPALERLARSDDVLVRRYILQALGNTRSPAAIPALLRAMDDGDREVQYNAVQSMARITGDLPFTTKEEFESRMNWYFVFWRDWARARGIAR